MHIAIIGNGISGITTARFLRKLTDYEITVISAETDYFFSRTALMYIYMGHMRYEDTKPYEDWFWEKNRINLVRDYVREVQPSERKLVLDKAGMMSYDKLVIACGSKSNKFGWPGQDLEAVHGLYSKQDLEAMERYSDGLQRAVIVGGGLIGIEMAEMFRSRDIPVTMLVREESYWNHVLPSEESEMVSRHIRDHHIDLRLGVNLKEIIDDGTGKACGVIVKETGEKIGCGYVGLTAGVSPNVDFLKDTDLEIGKGIIVNEYLETNLEGIYAIGDCAELKNPRPGRRPVEAIWYTGRMMGETLAYTLAGNKKKYDPGIWFNSAKFLDIEYQVYGTVLSEPPAEHRSLFWRHPDGRKSIRLVYHRETKEILGFNLLGVRYRHEVCERWIEDKAHVQEVLKDLSLANFDPEFYRQYEGELLQLYNNQSGKNIHPRQKRSLRRVLNFLNRS